MTRYARRSSDISVCTVAVSHSSWARVLGLKVLRLNTVTRRRDWVICGKSEIQTLVRVQEQWRRQIRVVQEHDFDASILTFQKHTGMKITLKESRRFRSVGSLDHVFLAVASLSKTQSTPSSVPSLSISPNPPPPPPLSPISPGELPDLTAELSPTPPSCLGTRFVVAG